MKEIITDVEKLSERSEEIDIRKENSLMRDIIIELKETLREHTDGVGLAAPQIGFNKRIFVINFKGDIRTFINPIITQTKGMTLNRESCLSLPGKEFIRPRHTEINVIYQTPLGKTESRKLVGLAAFCFQHELDHLDGLLISDIGLEVTEDFDKATEQEKDEVLNAYLDSLDMKRKQIDEEIKSDEDLKKTSAAIDFIQKLQKGEVELGEEVSVKKEADKKEE